MVAMNLRRLGVCDKFIRQNLRRANVTTTMNSLRLPPLSVCSRNAACPMPFAPTTAFPLPHPNSLFNLSRLSVWWLRLGITIERIRPGHPQQNGRHERMHRTLKMEATRPAGSNFLQQQAKFDAFVQE
jgi:hypothetical protein